MAADVESLLKEQRVAHLATVTPDGRPHVVPVVYAYEGSHFYIALDDKPKRTSPLKLQRVRNIQANPLASMLVDVYDENWAGLVWVRADGVARILRRGKAHDRAIELLRSKYPQYRAMSIEPNPVIEIKVTRLVHWTARGADRAPGSSP